MKKAKFFYLNFVSLLLVLVVLSGVSFAADNQELIYDQEKYLEVVNLFWSAD